MDVRNAIVALFRSADSTNKDDFVASAFFVADGFIVTARHAQESPARLWARPAADGVVSYEVRERWPHPELDIALLRIDTMPIRAAALALSLDLKPPSVVQMEGFFEGRRESLDGVQILNFDDPCRHYVFGQKQPEGHSGGALCHGDTVWGVPVRHYIDGNIPRGCAIAAHQFWDWLKPLLPVGHPLASVSAAGMSAPEWSQWVSEGRKELATVFKGAVYAKFDDVLARQADGLPEALRKVFGNASAPDLGEQCVESLITLARDCHQWVLDGDVQLSEIDRKALQHGFLAAMGCAARLSIDPAKLVSSGIDPKGKMTPHLEVPAFNAAGAGIALRTRPSGSWKLGQEAGIPVLKDKHVKDVPVETGAGVDTQSALARQAYLTLGEPRHAPDTLSESLCRTIKSRAKSEARDGRARILLLHNPESDAILADLQAWLEETLGVYLMVLRKPEDPSITLFSWDEDDLLARIASFLQLLDQPEWRCERQDS